MLIEQHFSLHATFQTNFGNVILSQCSWSIFLFSFVWSFLWWWLLLVFFKLNRQESFIFSVADCQLIQPALLK